MEVAYRVLNLYRSRRYERCLDVCGEAEGEGDRDRDRVGLAELARMRALTIRAKIAGSHYDESEYPDPAGGGGGGEERHGSAPLAEAPRPGTAFRTGAGVATAASRRAESAAAAGGTAAGARARLPATARLRTGTTAAGRTRTALATAARAARAATAIALQTRDSAGAGAASAPLTVGGGVVVGALASTPDRSQFHAVAKIIFEYILYSEGDVRKAMEIVTRAQKEGDTDDWWWNFSAAKCHMVLGLKRNAEECVRLALRQSEHVAVHLRLVATRVALDRPLAALEACGAALALFPADVALLAERARVHEALGDSGAAVAEYRRVAAQDADSTEAVASIAHHNFYNDQPEIALRYYRRLLATSAPSPELYNNLGLCCLACSQWDLVLGCFRHALFLATGARLRADLWFNLAHVALSAGDVALGARCLRASLSARSQHAPAADMLRALDDRLRSASAAAAASLRATTVP